jgi:GT2 family glycosyltransferase
METSGIRIFVIIPVYGNWEDTIECIEALASQSIPDFQILIADDGSPTPPPPAIGQSKRARYTRYEHSGFGSTCNRAAQQAIGLGATHLLLLNSDTTFGQGFMECWLRRAAAMPSAILGPLIFWASEPGRIWSSGGKLTVLTPFVRSRTRFEQVTPVDTVTGCALLVPSAVWTALGGFDPKYIMYFEDFDFTLRAKKRGVLTYILPDPELHVLHHVSGSFRGGGVWKKHYLMLTSSLLFIRSHYRGLRKPLSIALSFAHLGITTILSLPALPKPRPLWTALVQGFSR